MPGISAHRVADVRTWLSQGAENSSNLPVRHAPFYVQIRNFISGHRGREFPQLSRSTPGGTAQSMSSHAPSRSQEFAYPSSFNGLVRIRRGILRSRKTLVCRHLSHAYVLDRNNFLAASKSLKTLTAYAQENRSRFFTEKAVSGFHQSSVVVGAAQVGKFLTALCREMDAAGKTTYGISLTTRSKEKRLGHETAVYLERNEGDPCRYSLYFYDPNEPVEGAILGGRIDQIEKEVAGMKYWNIFADPFQASKVVVSSPVHNDNILTKARQCGLHVDVPGDQITTGDIRLALKWGDHDYLTRAAGRIRDELRHWDRKQRRVSLHALRALHDSSDWYDKVKKTHPEAYRAFKEIKNIIKSSL